MRTFMFSRSGISLLSALAYLALAASALVRAGDGADGTDAGKTSYRSLCAHCHGLDMAAPGDQAHALHALAADSKESFLEVVVNGRGSMPPWGDKLDAAELDALWAYVSSAGGAAEPSDGDAGK